MCAALLLHRDRRLWGASLVCARACAGPAGPTRRHQGARERGGTATRSSPSQYPGGKKSLTAMNEAAYSLGDCRSGPEHVSGWTRIVPAPPRSRQRVSTTPWRTRPYCDNRAMSALWRQDPARVRPRLARTQPRTQARARYSENGVRAHTHREGRAAQSQGRGATKTPSGRLVENTRNRIGRSARPLVRGTIARLGGARAFQRLPGLPLRMCQRAGRGRHPRRRA